MTTLRGMAEHRFQNVYNKQHFTLLWYLNKCFFPFSPFSYFPPLPFNGKFFMFLNVLLFKKKMSDQFVTFHLMQFQKLKHVATGYFEIKSSEKVNNDVVSLACLYA